MPKVRFTRNVRLSTKAIGLKGAEVRRTFMASDEEVVSDAGLKHLDEVSPGCYELLEKPAEKKVVFKKKRGD